MSFSGVFKKIFPFISAAASMSGNPLAVMAANAVGKAIGTDKVTPDNVERIIAGATPEQMIQLKQAEENFTLQMQELGFREATDLERIAADDRASARGREIATKDRLPGILAIMVSCGFFALLFCLMLWSPPVENQTLLNIVLGSLGTAWVSIISYYFGSSRGSDDKTVILSAAIGKAKQ